MIQITDSDLANITTKDWPHMETSFQTVTEMKGLMGQIKRHLRSDERILRDSRDTIRVCKLHIHPETREVTEYVILRALNKRGDGKGMWIVRSATNLTLTP